MKSRLELLLLALAMTAPALASAATAPASPSPSLREQDFTAFPLPSVDSASNAISEPGMKGVRAAIERHRCPSKGATLYRRPGKDLVVLLIPCYPPSGASADQEGYYAFLEYPLTLVVSGDSVEEVDLSKHGFMYESGSISAVTDIDADDMPELWLTGSVCECDGEPSDYGPEGCECNGGITVEFSDGRLQEWKHSDQSSSDTPPAQ